MEDKQECREEGSSRKRERERKKGIGDKLE
jgi:hypothetical protein